MNKFFDIDIKYLVPLKGKYNPEVFECCFCNNDMIDRFFERIIGFADLGTGTMAIIQCDKCFEYFYFHASKDIYDGFIAKYK